MALTKDAACVGFPLERVRVFLGMAAEAGVFVGALRGDLDLARCRDVKRAGSVTDLAADVAQIGAHPNRGRGR